MPIPAYFSPQYATTDTRLLARLGVTHDRLQRLGLISTRQAHALPIAALDGLHDSDYTQAFLTGKNPQASRQGITWTPAIRDATLAMLGGQLQAVNDLLAGDRIVMNIARGFHHAHPAAGSGFCPLNGLALVAKQFPDKRILVIDCDEHGGNGTEEFAAILPNLYNISVFGTRFGCRGGTRSWAFHITQQQGYSVYLEALQQSRSLIKEIQPDILLYQAGADCHEKDPKSLLKLSTNALFRRDLFVFQTAFELHLPVLFMVAGGYQSSQRVAFLNTNTVRAAKYVFRSLQAKIDSR